MKKTIIIAIVIIILFIFGLALFYIFDKEKGDNIKFKEEYESINNKAINGKKTLSIEIDENSGIKYVSFSELMEVLDSGTGIIYFGFPECPWCRSAIPTLIKAAKEMEVETIYYFNAYDIRDEKELSDGEIVDIKEGSDEYYKLLDKLDEVLTPYDGLNDDSIKRLYFPTTVFVMGGKIVGSHIGTVDSQEDPYKGLTKKEEKELLNIYKTNIEKIYGVCDSSC